MLSFFWLAFGCLFGLISFPFFLFFSLGVFQERHDRQEREREIQSTNVILQKLKGVKVL